MLLSSHLLARSRSSATGSAIVRSGAIVYEGAIAELRRGAGTALPAVDHRRRPRARGLPRRAGDRRRAGRARGRIIVRRADEAAVAELSRGARRGRGADPRAGAADGDARGPVLLAHRGRDRREPAPAAARAEPAEAVALMPGVAHRLPLGAAQAPLPEADLPRARRGGRRPDPVRGRDALPPRRRPERRRRSATTSTAAAWRSRSCILLFGAVWMFPLITALVAGDIVASEDHNGTLKTILTRSLEREQIFAGKALAAATYAVVAILLDGTVGGGRRAASSRGSTRCRACPARRLGARRRWSSCTSACSST